MSSNWTKKEWEEMKLQFATSFVPKAGGKVKLPSAFTEKGLTTECQVYVRMNQANKM
jgi:hypothetical protein